VIPKVFSNADDFARFGTDARESLAKAGYENVEPILQGSAITGQQHKGDSSIKGTDLFSLL
ncbi:hypothetical protein P3E18_25970, partial [Pseudomonas aeruginosa]